MKKKLIVLLFLGFMFSAAPLALAQGTTGGNPTRCVTTAAGAPITNLQGVLCKMSELLNAVLPVLIALGVVYFVWGVVTYVIAGDDEAKKKGRDRIIAGLIGLVIIIALWGLVNIVRNTFLGSQSNTININLPTTPY